MSSRWRSASTALLAVFHDTASASATLATLRSPVGRFQTVPPGTYG